MSSILLVTSSPRGAASHSTRVATELAAKLREANPLSTLVVRDLVANPLPHIDPDYSTGIYTPAEARTQRQAEVVAVSDAALDEVFAADTVILATGFINFNISSTLKSWIDHIARSGRSFAYGENGPKGLVPARRCTSCWPQAASTRRALPCSWIMRSPISAACWASSA